MTLSQSMSQTPSKRPREMASTAANRLDVSNNGSPCAPPKKPQPLAVDGSRGSRASSTQESASSSSAVPAEWHGAATWPAGASPAVWHRHIVTTSDELRTLLTNRRDDSTIVFVALAPWCVAQWQACLGDADVSAMLARDASTEAYLVDVDAVEEATELLQITTSQLPSAHCFHQDPTVAPSAAPVKRAQKALTSPIDLVSVLCVQPIFGIAHLHRRLERTAAAASASGKSAFVVCYSGAVWCPPCCRIMPQIGDMRRALAEDLSSKGVVVEFVKADRDTSGVVDLVYDVKLIPTFQVFRAADAPEGHSSNEAIASLPAVAPAVGADDDGETSAWESRIAAAREAVVKPIGQLQNSQRANVQAFLERHCAPLTFDEDF
eukprot:CAMPEP_0174854810 /NCGR_PEP_ID=MMETSP1114-20130205/31963_1 /TAXON_ID=312471 /ORGANISM="Neobodo designis, Strain CCAP 1951/1" /LENGTH=377 /DNA_ID=CAMNT_0016089521 /DNA_START=100 /DNA_END=1233 /DNA_ORIENTATION=+